MKLAGRLADDVNALKQETERMAQLREVGHKKRGFPAGACCGVCWCIRRQSCALGVLITSAG